jgi:hypothetical protein
MAIKKRFPILASIALIGIIVVGCRGSKDTSVKSVITSLIPEDYLVSVVEEESNVILDKYTLRNVEITLNLETYSQSVLDEKIMEYVTNVISATDLLLEDKINNYKFIINSSYLDIYGNNHKVKVMEIAIDKETVDKINFANFDYKNLEAISTVTRFDFLANKEEIVEEVIEDEEEGVIEDIITEENSSDESLDEDYDISDGSDYNAVAEFPDYELEEM